MREPYPVDVLLTLAADRLKAAAAGDRPTRHMSQALRLALTIAAHPNASDASSKLIAKVEAGFDVALPVIVKEAEGEMDLCHVALCMGQARGLLPLLCGTPEEIFRQRGAWPQILDRLDYATLLALQLEALDCARRIEARGNHLALSLAVQLGIAG